MARLAALATAACLSLAILPPAAAAVASPPADTGTLAFGAATTARASAERALMRARRELEACRRSRPGHCRSKRRDVSRARIELLRAEHRLLEARTRASSARRTTSSNTKGGGKRGGASETASGESTSAPAETAGSAETSGSGGTGTGGETGGSGATGAGGETGAGGSAVGSSSGTSETGTSETASTGAAESPTGSEASAFASEPFVKGIDTNLQGWGVEAVPKVAAEMRTLGVSWEREDLEWSKVEPEKGVFHWSSFDAILTAAEQNGITLLPIVGYAPSWAAPTDAADYAAFVKAAVQRYGPGTAANLRWWELWNEPYFAYAWSGRTPEPEAYARDALAAAQAAKAVSPAVKLLIAADYQDAPQAGGSTPWETSWIDDMFTAAPSLGKWIDGVSVHPYGDDPALTLLEAGGWKDSEGKWAFQRIETIRAKFLAHSVNLPFWITEVGWSTAEVSEAQQALFYADLAPQIAARPWVRAMFPYCLREFSKTGSQESAFGLLKYGTWEPKEAFYALQAGLATLS